MATETESLTVPDDPYSDGESTVEEVETTETDNPETKPKDDGAATELLSKSFFGDKSLKPGTRCEIEIVRVTDSQVIARKVPDSEYHDDDAPAANDDLMDD
jgi:hypothetical protein